ncbi:auxilin-like protein 1 [Amaranthus tricolor]|uniref:auxilin-like protein 1 n=1 Tax=Amaranthus tricolor TaxID=29722 RepID=UPI0025895598|nr:auxilin-like protein 1 [Amaranthus tricolor]XP_057529274.1 auxilin-like protein 1 [Amaranthus tricolor]
MERPYSHSKSPAFSNKKPPPFSSSSSSFNNNAGFFNSTSYDDVFGGPPKFASSSSLAPRPEDYSEIFGGFRLSSFPSRSSSSIPVLDLPAVPDDIHSAAAFFDYSEVFGGFNAINFAVPFDELFRPCNGSFCDDDGGSSDEAWTPAGSDSHSDDSDMFAFSEKNESLSNENTHQPSENKQFNVSYHKINPETSAHMTNTTHATQLNDVPGYTCVVDEAINRKSSSPVLDDSFFSTGSTSQLTQKQTKKTRSNASYNDTGSKTYDSDQRSGEACGASTSHINITCASMSDINLQTEPSHLPPSSRPPSIMEDRSRDFGENSSSPVASERNGLEASNDGSSPLFFDMEVDASSSAAVSAAAMKDAMVKAQAKLEAAKERRDRKDRIQNCGKLHLETGVNGRENTQGIHDEAFYGEVVVHTTSDSGPTKIKIFSKSRHSKNVSQNFTDILAAEQSIGVSGVRAETKQGKKCSLSMDTEFIDAAGEWKEATQYFEFVNSDYVRLDPHRHSSSGVENITIKQQGDDDHNSDSAGEACATVENRRRLKATKVVSRQEYYEKMVKVAQEVHDTVTCGHVEPDKKVNHMSRGNTKQLKPELAYEPEKLEIPLCKAQKMEENPVAAFRSNIVLEEDECKQESESCHSGQLNRNAEGLLESMVDEASIVRQGELRISCESKWNEGGYDVQETTRNLHEQRAEESFERQRTESQVTESLTQKINKQTRELMDKSSKESCKGVLMGDKMQTACESEEKDHTKDLQRTNAADKRVKETFENVSGRNRLQENIDKNNLGNLQHGEEFVNHLEEAANGKGFKKKFEKFVELEESQKSKEVPKQAIEIQRISEDHNLKIENKNSQTGRKEDKKEKLVKTAELEHVEQKSLQACELEKVYCGLEEAVDELGSKTNLEKCFKLKKSEKSQEVPKQPIRLQRLDDSSNLIVEDEKSEDVNKQDERKKYEKAIEPEQNSLRTYELEKTRKTNNNTDDQEDWKGVDGHDMNIKWDEDVGLNSSSDIELPIQGNTLKSSNGTDPHRDAALDMSCKLSKPLKDDDSEEGTSQNENGEIHVTSSDGRSKLDAAVMSNVVIDEKKIEPEAALVGPEDNELEGGTFHASNKVDLDENNIKTCNSTGDEQNLKEKKKVQSTPDPCLAKDLNDEVGGKRNLSGENYILLDKEEKVRSTRAEGINGFHENTSREKVTHTVLPVGKARFQKPSHPPKCGQSIDRKDKIIHNCSTEEKDVDKEINLEKERLRKFEEEKERLREREKDRMAVEYAVREARDRAYADARDRAERVALERATDEARLRAMAEARERLEKACAEARERSLADKASESRLKAERAAVERATAEARPRAMEKAKAERSTFDTRDRMQRSVSEKHFSEREVMMRQSSIPTISERLEESNGEPVQRCKARLERHRRTVERVAKALADKNMRDLLAQREQAERTRLAENLDADIRRWSNGKEGNLRALLSTLQYILGPDSGWQAIPLTEVITAAAVKKAYRKATLCVHPDKLQQRGASIQQKYICEKVFDLLKDAWNRFNSEEK